MSKKQLPHELIKKRTVYDKDKEKLNYTIVSQLKLLISKENYKKNNIIPK